jgi:hypothetical protein
MMHYDYYHELARARMDERLHQARQRRLARAVRDRSPAVRSRSLVRWVLRLTAAGRKTSGAVEKVTPACLNASQPVDGRPPGDDVPPRDKGGEAGGLTVAADGLEVSLEDDGLEDAGRARRADSHGGQDP